MEIVEAGCSRGSSFDCGSAAFALANGSHGVARDPARAAPLAGRMIELEQKACDDEDGSACAALARPYESGTAEGEPEGTVVKRDSARATALRKRACELGFQSACGGADGPKH
jgi:TPR repeat protein